MKRTLAAALFLLTLTSCVPVTDTPRAPETYSGHGVTVITREPGTTNGCDSPFLIIKSSQGALSSVGNACVVRHNGKLFVLTAWHVISDGGTITVWNNSNEQIGVALGDVKKLPSSDVAVIPVLSAQSRLASLEISTSALQVGSSCDVEGYDHTGKKVRYTGAVKAVKLETDCRVERGLSGSPLISNGKVVGVTTSIVSITDPVTGLTSNGGGHVSAPNFITLLE